MNQSLELDFRSGLCQRLSIPSIWNCSPFIIGLSLKGKEGSCYLLFGICFKVLLFPDSVTGVEEQLTALVLVLEYHFNCQIPLLVLLQIYQLDGWIDHDSQREMHCVANNLPKITKNWDVRYRKANYNALFILESKSKLSIPFSFEDWPMSEEWKCYTRPLQPSDRPVVKECLWEHLDARIWVWESFHITSGVGQERW